MLHLLKSLQYLEMKASSSGGAVERRRLSFRALDIEQIGHVYEGLLDHTAKRATEPILGLLGAKNREPEVALATLEKVAGDGWWAAGEEPKPTNEFIEFLKDQTGKSESAIRNALVSPATHHDPRATSLLQTACGGDAALLERVLPFAKLIRNDTFGYPVVIPAGSVFVTTGTDRRSSGTHYTPRALTEPIVQYTLEPLVYIGPAEGLPKSEWRLKSAKELLALKICDMACGSGAFLVQACRYLAERLLEAWEAEEIVACEAWRVASETAADPATHHAPRITPFGSPSTGRAEESLIPDDPQERKLYAMRLIAQRCLYGVDINPLAVEMCKLSLWLLTMAKDKPFEFLDHNIRCGDSLVGLHNIDQLRHFNLKPDSKEAVLFGGPFEEAVEEAISLRLKLEEMPSNTIEDVRAQEKLLNDADDKIARLRCAADLLVAAEFWGENAKDKLERVNHAVIKSGHYIENGPMADFQQVATKERRGQTMFHWPLEFPEVIVTRGGFDAFVCNPPFMGGKKISGSLSASYRDYLVQQIAEGARGHADISAYFALRGAALLKNGGHFGFLATNTISQGDTREVGLDQLLGGGCTIPRAVPSLAWPGVASLEVAVIWLTTGKWHGEFVLSTSCVTGITSFLTVPNITIGLPHRLLANQRKSFQGTVVLGTGFFLDPVVAEGIINADSRCETIIYPYLNGEDLNSRPDQSPSRFVINFHDWPLEVAERYGDCFKIVEEKVKPDRDKVKRKLYRERWWQFAERCPGLYGEIATLPKVLVVCQTSKFHSFVFVPNGIVFANKLVVFSLSEWSALSLLSSTVHAEWVFAYGSTLETRPVYTPTDCFETFPFPEDIAPLSELGESYSALRRQIMATHNEGLTKTYNRFHSVSELKSDIQKLRDLHVEMDVAVAAAYGWTDLELDHGFHETKQGVRFTISEPARREVLQRLLKLNHERYAEEVKQGLHDKKAAKQRPAAYSTAEPDDQETVAPPTQRRAPKKSPKPKSSAPQTIAEERTLFNMEDDE